MPLKNVELFNGFRPMGADDQPITQFYSQKTKALLAYLLLEGAERGQGRSYLAGLLWPDSAENRARRNLSQTLNALRKNIDDAPDADSLFITSSQEIGLNRGVEVSVDVWAFKSHLAAVNRHDHASLNGCETCIQHLEAATDLYTGPFLDQFGDGDSDLFEVWLMAERESLEQQAIGGFDRLAQIYQAQGRLNDALRVADRLLEIVPWRESVHRLKMLLLAQKGNRIAALNQYNALTDALMAELGVPPSAETDALYDQIMDEKIKPAGQIAPSQLTAEPVELESVPVAIPFQAPRTPPHFVGREKEMGLIKELFEADGDSQSPIALVGMGGIGKSALATQITHECRETFADGILWGDPVTSHPLDILDVWAQAYGADFAHLPDIESRATAVRGLLADKKTLIVLDNVDDATTVRPLLPSGGACQVLVTTRNMEVAAALNARHVRMQEFTAESSEKLMIRILGEPRLAGPPEQHAEVKRISKQLHHLPLAIEIAAQRLRSRPSMPLAALATRLEDTQQRLGLKISDQAVRSSFEVSWEGLQEMAQAVFSGVGVFEGRSFSAEALSAVTQLDLFDVEDELYSLIALSLVNELDNGRYQQHPLLADFATEKLRVNARKVNDAHQRLITYYLQFLRDAGSNFSRLTHEWDQLAGIAQAAFQLEDWDSLIELCDLLTPAWKARGRYSQARTVYALAQRAAIEINRVEQEADILLSWGEATLEQNDYEEAKTLLEQSLSKYQQTNHLSGVAQVQYQLARVAIERSQFDVANQLLLDSKQSLEATSTEIGLGDILFRQGYIAFADGFRLDEAWLFFAEALEKYENEENEIGKIEVLRLQAQIEEKRDNYDGAEALALEAKRLSEQIQDRGQLASVLYVLTYIYLAQEKLERAKQCAEESREILNLTGRKRTEGLVLRQLSRIYKQLGDYNIALNFGQQSLEIFELLGIQLSQAFTLNEIAEIYELQGDSHKAKAAWQTAYQLAKQLNHAPLKESIQNKLA